MAHTEARYINPQIDFGFKRLFGSEFNKELLISFLNALFGGKQNVQDIVHIERIHSRRAIFDVYCKNDKGENSSWKYRTYTRSFSRTGAAITPLSPFVSRHDGERIEISI